jgi:hypothetical protein
MSLIHLLFNKASWRVLLFAILFGIVSSKLGAMSIILRPNSHLSVKVRDPFPTSEIRTVEKRARALSGTWIGRFLKKSRLACFSRSQLSDHITSPAGMEAHGANSRELWSDMINKSKDMYNDEATKDGYSKQMVARSYKIW